MASLWDLLPPTSNIVLNIRNTLSAWLVFVIYFVFRATCIFVDLCANNARGVRSTPIHGGFGVRLYIATALDINTPKVI